MLLTDCEDDRRCCPAVFDIADHILAEVFIALQECMSAECPGLIAYVTMGAGDDTIADSVTVELNSITPSASSSGSNQRQLPFSIQRVDYTVRLRETGWPMPKVVNNQIVAPDPVLQNKAAQQAFSHGEKMFRKLWALHSSKQLTPTGTRCLGTRVGQLLPMRPDGGRVGFTVNVTVDLP